MKIAIKLKAKNDPDGNPRRGWLVYEINEKTEHWHKCLGWVEEGYNGDCALTREYPGAVTIVALNVPYSEYAIARTDH